MHDPIYLYIKQPSKNRRGYAWAYASTTNWSKTCREAKERFADVHGWDPDSIYAAKQRGH